MTTVTRPIHSYYQPAMARQRTPKLHPFTIAIDTREQCPFTFSRLLFGHESRMMIWTRRQTLKTGDYSIVGYEDKIAVERKSLIDLFSTLGQQRDRFEREFQRLAELEFSAIVVEGDFRDVLHPEAVDPMWPSKTHPHTILGTVQSWQQRYKTSHWWFCPNRQFAEQMTFGILEKYYRYSVLNKHDTHETNEFGSMDTSPSGNSFASGYC